MKLAQIAPLTESVPPRLYGGTERIVSYLTEELVRQGHEVVLFASGDSETSAHLVPCTTVALRMNPDQFDPVVSTMTMLEQVRKRAHEFDIMHFHTDLAHFSLFSPFSSRTLTTMHGRLDLPELALLYRQFPKMPLASISLEQRKPLPKVNWVANVPHGIPAGVTRFFPEACGGYLAFLGRISPEKRPDLAIRIAKRAGIRLKIAAKVDQADQAYFESVIRPLLDDPLIDWIGEISEADKPSFLGDAMALLFPINWPEPFGLVMIEAMACGTPTIAYRDGSVPEVIENGKSGFIVNDEDEALNALARLTELDRAEVRSCYERRFTAERMTEDYLRTYESLLGVRTMPAPGVTVSALH